MSSGIQGQVVASSSTKDVLDSTLLLPADNCHLQVQSQHSLHENGALVPLGDLLYVTGGCWKGMDGDYHVEMEAYDTVRDAWACHGSLPRLWLYHGASTIFLDISKWTQPFSSTAPQEH